MISVLQNIERSRDCPCERACSYTNVLQHSNPALPRTLNQDLGMNWVNGQNLITLGEQSDDKMPKDLNYEQYIGCHDTY